MLIFRGVCFFLEFWIKIMFPLVAFIRSQFDGFIGLLLIEISQ